MLPKQQNLSLHYYIDTYNTWYPKFACTATNLHIRFLPTGLLLFLPHQYLHLHRYRHPPHHPHFRLLRNLCYHHPINTRCFVIIPHSQLHKKQSLVSLLVFDLFT